jgi:hypothetical protein
VRWAHAIATTQHDRLSHEYLFFSTVRRLHLSAQLAVVKRTPYLGKKTGLLIETATEEPPRFQVASESLILF